MFCFVQPHLRATDRPSSIADRLSLLGNAQEGWRTRVAEKDMSRFTVEGKMTSAGKTASPRKVEKRATPDAAKSKMGELRTRFSRGSFNIPTFQQHLFAQMLPSSTFPQC